MKGSESDGGGQEQAANDQIDPSLFVDQQDGNASCVGATAGTLCFSLTFSVAVEATRLIYCYLRNLGRASIFS
jgi:hypothetical protein